MWLRLSHYQGLFSHKVFFQSSLTYPQCQTSTEVSFPYNLHNASQVFPSIHLPMQERQETQVQSLGGEDPLEEEMATHCRILAWKVPQREKPGRLQSMGSQGVEHDWVMQHTELPHDLEHLIPATVTCSCGDHTVLTHEMRLGLIFNWTPLIRPCPSVWGCVPRKGVHFFPPQICSMV